MSSFKSEFLNALSSREFIHQCTDLEALDTQLAAGPLTAYIGYDCTAPSLHVGNLLTIMLLRHLQQSGHRPIVLMGGGTTKVGDPSGKDESRQLLSIDAIQENMNGIKQVFSRFVRFGDGPTDAIMVNNADWLDRLSYVDFLRDYGRHFSVNRMLSMDSVRLRLEREQPLSFLEFNYMILQAYDFVELGKRYNCLLQMGGSDQWGNIVNGVELGRRAAGLGLFGLTAPLITTASGVKMGKSVGGAVWLNPDMRSPYDYWQFWRNTEDADVGRFLRLFTELPLDEIARLEALKDSEINSAKIALADEATRMAHGEDARRTAAETARQTFAGSGVGSDLPSLTVAKARLAEGVPAYELYCEVGLTKSNGEARRFIKGGGARINDTAFNDENRRLTMADVTDGHVIKLSIGKKRHALIRPEGE